jgi:hypothetical protein
MFPRPNDCDVSTMALRGAIWSPRKLFPRDIWLKFGTESSLSPGAILFEPRNKYFVPLRCRKSEPAIPLYMNFAAKMANPNAVDVGLAVHYPTFDTF